LSDVVSPGVEVKCQCAAWRGGGGVWCEGEVGTDLDVVVYGEGVWQGEEEREAFELHDDRNGVTDLSIRNVN
jgi:hypothetical protein